ncbi:MAG: hypothetical protein HKN42_01360, partial [Granulosicoccus sp.]|nr:hypothetical protein [Granulosicoccus sp.]
LKDHAEVRRLTSESERNYAYLDYVFDNFVRIDVAVSNISVSRQEQTVQGTLQIRQLFRSNGDRVFPPAQFMAIPIHSIRKQEWSRINW